MGGGGLYGEENSPRGTTGVGRQRPGHSGDASRLGSGAWLASQRRGSIELFGAAVAMVKSRTRGRRGLYLRVKGVMRVLDFIPNLISNRIRDSFQFH
jgi:hypothetical protein